jgi:hypothetical protein
MPLRTISVLVLWGIATLPFPCTLRSQTDGHALAARQQNLQAALNKIDSADQQLSGTLDQQIFNTLTTRAWMDLHNAQSAISMLEYPTAEILLDSAAREIKDAATITKEDQPIPKATLLRESQEDKYLDTMGETLPQALNGTEERALIYSEYSLTQKMIAKARFHLCRWTMPLPEGTSIDNYLKVALSHLYDLDYEDSHKMMYEAYLVLQDALAHCQLP